MYIILFKIKIYPSILKHYINIAARKVVYNNLIDYYNFSIKYVKLISNSINPIFEYKNFGYHNDNIRNGIYTFVFVG